MNKSTRIIAVVLMLIFLIFFIGQPILKLFKKDKVSSQPENTPNTTENLVLKPAPVFNEDSAYYFLEKQVQFGPRIPGTASHKQCGTWIDNQLKSFGATTTIQKFDGVDYNGKSRPSFNIIGAFNPAATKRIIIAAHWDTRPIADKDTKDKNKPIDGAIDGASGVAVALEIARNLSKQPLAANIGIDFIFFDNEDNGEPNDFTGQSNKNYWCLGSQYWAKNKHIPNYTAFYGILLDMVGAKGTVFKRELISNQYATSINDAVWNMAAKLGYSDIFKNETGMEVNDDHYEVNTTAKIPMIDIISHDSNNGFGAYHHTHNDNLNSVSKRHLKAVGHTVLQVLYNEE